MAATMTPSTAPWTTLCPYFFSPSLPLCRTLGGSKGGSSSSTISLSPATAQASSASKPQGRGLPLASGGPGLDRRQGSASGPPGLPAGEESKLELALSLKWARVAPCSGLVFRDETQG
jgi:hypothetical protein